MTRKVLLKITFSTTLRRSQMTVAEASENVPGKVLLPLFRMIMGKEPAIGLGTDVAE